MFRNEGPSEQYGFVDVRAETEIATKTIGGGEDELMVGVAWGDYDNDGYQDLFLPQIYNDVSYAFSYLYHNDGDGTFTEVSNATGVRVWDTYGGAWCDYNNDGWLDLVTGGKGDSSINGTHEVHLYRNSGNSNSWLQLTLGGTVSNTAAIGARVEVTNNITTQIRQVEGGMGSHSMQNSLTLEYGWGSYSGTVDISVRWPSGIVQNLTDISLNQNLKITEPEIYPDLDVVISYTGSTYPISGDTIDIHLIVKNLGKVLAADATVVLNRYHTESDESMEIVRIDIGCLGPSCAEVDYVYEWDTSGEHGNFTFNAELLDVKPGDPSTDNNKFTLGPLYVRATNQLPVAKINAEPTTAGVGQKIVFDAKGSHDDISIEYYKFYFGDGSDSGWTGGSANHTYSAAGEYDAYLVAKDNDGEESNSQNPDSHVLIKINGSIPVNHAPVINKVDYNPKTVAPGGTVKISVDAYDEDGDEISYEYSASAGWFSEFDSEVTWNAPQEEGDHRISVYVSDGFLDSDIYELTITVSEDAPVNLPPVIDSLKVTPPVIGLNGDASVTVDAYDPEDNELLYVYSVTGGKISGTGASVRYISPGIEGEYQLSVFVSDGELDSITATTTIKVFENDPPEISRIHVDPEEVPAGDSATINVIAIDPDGDELEYSYIPEAGDISGTGNKVVWTAPMDVGEYEIKVVVTDPLGFGVEDTVRITVIYPGEGPQIIDYSLLPNIVGNDGTAEVVITVELVHPLGLSHIDAVYIDLSDIGGKTMQELYDNGRYGDEKRNDGTYTYEFGIPQGTEPGEYGFYISIQDTEGKVAGTTMMLEVTDTTKSDTRPAEGLTTIQKMILVIVVCVIFVVVILYGFYLMTPKKPKAASIQ
jgi:hypothetical protein